MNFGRSFSFVFQDPEWVKKVLIGGLVSLIPIVGNFMAAGYVLEVTKDTVENNDSPMPEWNDLGGYLVRGFLLQIGALIWMLPLIILIACGALVTVAAFSGSDVFGGVILFSNICLFAVLILIWSVAFIPMMTARYAVEQRFSAMLEIGEIIRDARNAGVALLILFLITIVASLIGAIGLIVCFIGVIFTQFYAYLVIGQAIGQTYRKARNEINSSSSAAF